MKNIMKKTFVLLFSAIALLGVAAYSIFKDASAVAAMPTDAQTTTGYGIGDAVADFSLKNVDGNNVSLAGIPNAKGYIVAFTCNHCPFSKAYEDRIIALNQKYAPQGFPVLAINPNDPAAYEEDSFANMQARAKDKKYGFPYLVDDTQAVAKAFGATRTPHLFVLKRSGDKNTVEYIGAIDDNSQDPSGVTKRYVEDAVNNLLAGKPVAVNSTKAIGCSIKWQ
jgi:glutathione peroxidase-family protein